MISRSPATTLAELKPNDAVMIVATNGSSAGTSTGSSAGSSTAAGAASAPANVTAITLVSGVEPILAATPKDSQPASLSAWTLGGDTPTQ